MSNLTPKPDLDETINVSEAHERLLREAAAATREYPLKPTGQESISPMIVVICFLVAIISGLALARSGKWFTYGKTFQENYVRTKPPGLDESGPKPREALAAYIAKGAKIYSSKCNGCHGADGKGDGVNYPSLADSKWAHGETERFALIILHGLQGPTSYGKPYGAGLMAAQGAGMSAQDLATVMTYVRNALGKPTGDIVTTEMAQAAMDIAAKRANPSAPTTAVELEAHAKMLPGAVLDPKLLVNPANLTPAPAK